MNLSLKIEVIPVIFLFLVACSSSSKAAIPNVQLTSTEQIDTSTPSATPFSTFTPRPTQTGTLTPTASFTPLPTKEVLLQYGIYGGDGGRYTDYYFGRDTPKLILFTDGQLLIQKRDNHGVWFEETTLTVPQICSLLLQIEGTGFFNVQSDGSQGVDDPIYQFDHTTQYSEGGPVYVIQVNGNKHKQVNIYYAYVPYLIPEIKRAFDLVDTYSPPSKLSAYQGQHLLLWIQKNPDDSIYSTPAPPIQQWPFDLLPFDRLEKDRVETGIYLGEYQNQVSQVLIEGETARVTYELFGNRLAHKLFQDGNSQYYVIPRPLLPHETLQDLSPFPYEDKEFDLPFQCIN